MSEEGSSSMMDPGAMSPCLGGSCVGGLGLLPFRNLGSRGSRISRFFLSRPKKRSRIVRRPCDEGAKTGRRQVQWVWGWKGRRWMARSSSQCVEGKIQWIHEAHLLEPLSATKSIGSLRKRGRNTAMKILNLSRNFGSQDRHCLHKIDALSAGAGM